MSNKPFLLSIGIDIDNSLILRAIEKSKSSPKHTAFKFAQLDILSSHSVATLMKLRSDLSLEVKCLRNQNSADVSESCRSDNFVCSRESKSTSAAVGDDLIEPFDLVFAFGITMWIHLNNGDQALFEFLHTISSLSRVLIVEAQPWKCYKNAKKRLRKLGMV